jgi:hypothetical protein
MVRQRRRFDNWRRARIRPTNIRVRMLVIAALERTLFARGRRTARDPGPRHHSVAAAPVTASGLPIRLVSSSLQSVRVHEPDKGKPQAQNDQCADQHHAMSSSDDFAKSRSLGRATGAARKV